MAINLRKITRDIANADNDVRVLALTTCLQLNRKSAENQADFTPLYQALSAIAAGKDAELAFLAAKGQAHVKSILLELGIAVPEDPTPAAGPPAADTREQVLAGLRVETEPGAIATLVAKLKALPGDDITQLSVQYTRHKEPRVRAAALQVVASRADEKATTVLLIPMLADPDQRVKATAARVLGKFARENIAGVLGEMIASNRMPFREASVWLMGHLRGEDMVALLPVAAKDPYGAIRARAARGMANQASAASQAALTALAADADATVREEAKKGLLVLAGKAQPQEQLFDLDELAATLPADSPMTQSGTIKIPQVEKSGKEQAQDEINRIEKLLSGQTKLPRLELTGKSYDQLLGIEGEQMVMLGRTMAEECRTGRCTHPELMRHYYDFLEYRDKIKQRREKIGDKDVSLTGSLFNLVRAKAGVALPAEDPMRKLEERLHQAIMGLAKTGLDLMEKAEIKVDQGDDYVKRHKALRGAIAAAKGGAGPK